MNSTNNAQKIIISARGISLRSPRDKEAATREREEPSIKVISNGIGFLIET